MAARNVAHLAACRNAAQQPRGHRVVLWDVERTQRSGSVVALGELLTAPLTQRRCVAYHAVVDEPGLFRRAVVVREQSATPFALHDGTLIGDVARIELPTERYFQTGHLIEPGPDLSLFLTLHGARHVDFLGLNRSLQFREGIVLPGDRVLARGRGSWEPTAIGPGGGYRDPPRRLVLRDCSISVIG